jgi:hypothetical protein
MVLSLVILLTSDNGPFAIIFCALVLISYAYILLSQQDLRLKNTPEFSEVLQASANGLSTRCLEYGNG